MKRRYLLPLFAVIGIGVAIAAVIYDNQTPTPAPAPIQQSGAPCASCVVGIGIIEAFGGSIAVGTPVSGVVTALHVTWGDQVKAGDPLFSIDDADLRAQLQPALSRVKQSSAKLELARDQFKVAENVTDKRAVSAEELSNRRHGVSIASSTVAVAQAEVTQIELEIGRRTIRALVPGKILQIGIRPGEFATSGAPALPLMVLGDDSRFWVRTDIDEFDAGRIRSGAVAKAYVRGNPSLHALLRFERMEPIVVPKTSLTGSGTERVDARVQQIIYSVDPSALPGTHIGQQLDVFIETPAAAGSP